MKDTWYAGNSHSCQFSQKKKKKEKKSEQKIKFALEKILVKTSSYRVAYEGFPGNLRNFFRITLSVARNVVLKFTLLSSDQQVF